MTNLLNELKNVQAIFPEVDETNILQFLTSLSEEEGSVVERVLMDQLPVSIIIIDAKGIIKFVNSISNELFKREGLTQGIFVDEVLPEIELTEILRNQKEQKAETFRLDGGSRVSSLRRQLLTKDGRLMGAIAICQPLSEMIRFVEKHIEVQDLNKVFDGIVGNSDMAYYITDESGMCRYVNDAYVQLTGIKSTDHLHKENKDHPLHKTVLEKRRPEVDRCTIGRFKKPVIVNVTPLMINGKLKGTIGVYHYAEQMESIVNELERSRSIIRNLEEMRNFEDIIAHSPLMKLACEQAKVASRTMIPVLVRGESGTGKRLFSEVIHNESERNYNRLVRMKCASICEEDFEDLLFKEMKDHIGRTKSYLEQANGGTLVLEDVEYLPVIIQEKLVEYLSDEANSNIKLIALSSCNLEQAIMNKKFNEKFYYYLSRMPIYLPTLNEREEDLKLLVEKFVQEFNDKLSLNIKEISPLVYKEIVNKKWCANIIELRNFIEAMMIATNKTRRILKPTKVESAHSEANDLAVGALSLQESLEVYEKKIISEVYKANEFNKTKTAQALNVSVRNLYYKLNKFGIE